MTSANSERAGPIVIAGNGRSGTNWLLTIVDASEVSHCRNEPLDLPTSPIHQLPSPGVGGTIDEATMARTWDRFSEWTRNRVGVRDQFVEAPKRHYWWWAQRSGVVNLVRRRRFRQARGLLVRPTRRDEWLLPRWQGSRARLAAARPVFKINDFAPWHCAWVVAERDATALAIVRHPGGYLDSALRRHFDLMSADELAAARLHFAALFDLASTVEPVWSERAPDVESLDAVSLSLWVWAAYNSMYLDVVDGHDAAHLVIFDELAADPLPTARRVYEACRLEFSAGVEARVTAGLGTNVWGDTVERPTDVAAAWRTALSAERRAEVDRVLEAAPRLAALWPGG